MERRKSTFENSAMDLSKFRGLPQKRIFEVSGGYLGNELENEESNHAVWGRNGGANELP